MSAALVEELAGALAAAGVAARAGDAERLVMAARRSLAGQDAAQLAGLARALARRVIAGEPLAYVTGEQDFMGLELLAAPGALVPREETELLGRSALAVLQELVAGGHASPRLIDMCCGSCNLGCALAHHLPGAQVWASDLTDGCIALARRNIDHTGLGARIRLAQGDLFAPLAGLGLEDSIDLVVCNPPYISQGKLAGERSGLLEHEPLEAFDGGPYGLSIHQRVIRDAWPYLRPGGWLMFEFGLGQERQLRMLFERARTYQQFGLINDSAGQARVAVARKPTA